MQNTQDILNDFVLLVDDTSELSSDEMLSLAEKIYRKVLNNKTWEILKKEYSGTTNGTTTLSLPTDFLYLVDNYNYTDNTIETVQRSRPCVIFVDNQPFRIVNWSDRRQYTNNANVCWVDVLNGNLVFAKAPSSGATVSYDYIHKPAALTLSTGPIFPSDFYPVISYGMAVDDMSMQLFDKARSYARENQIKYDSYLADMAYYNSNLQMN